MIAAIIVGQGSVWGGEPRRAEYYAGLRSRRLFRIAEEDCQRRLANPQLSDAQRAQLTIELSKTFAAHATFAAGEEREELWARADALPEEFLQSAPTSRFRSLVATQQAMVPATRGAQLRWQGELFPSDDNTRQLAETTLRDALSRLEPLAEDLDATLRSILTASRSDQDGVDAPAPFDIHQLRRVVEFTQAVAALDLAKVLRPGPDRTAVLHDADRQFDDLIRIARPDAMAWQSRVHRLDILRLREPADRILGQINAFLKTDPPSGFRDAAVAVLARSYLGEHRPDDALAMLEEHRQQHGLESEQLQALVVETFLSARRLAQEKGDDSLSRELLQRSEQIDARLSGPWRALTRLRLAEARDADRYGPALAGLVSEANWAWKNGQVESAIEAYGRAASEAHRQSRADVAVELALTTASIQIEAGRFEEASRSLDQLLQAYPTAKQGPEADLLRTYALGRIYQQDPSQEHKISYRGSLAKHRATFTASPTAAEATWMLARLEEHDQNWETALELFSSIPPQSPRQPTAQARMAAIFERIISDMRSQNRSAEAWEQRAEVALAQAVDSFPPSPARLSFEQASVVATLARILLHRVPTRFAAADTLLARVMDSGRVIERDTGSLDASWQALVASASQQRIVSLTGQGRVAEARTMLETVQDRQPERLLDVLLGLSEIAGDMEIEHRSDLGQLQLELAEILKSRQLPLSDAEQRKLDMVWAQAQVATGHWQEAAKVYEELLWKQPQDREILQALATLYEECGTSSCLKQAMKRWQDLESLQRKGTPDWLESRYHMAWCSHQLGEWEVARKLIGVTRVLYPEMGNPALKARFDALQKELAAEDQK